LVLLLSFGLTVAPFHSQPVPLVLKVQFSQLESHVLLHCSSVTHDHPWPVQPLGCYCWRQSHNNMQVERLQISGLLPPHSITVHSLLLHLVDFLHYTAFMQIHSSSPHSTLSMGEFAYTFTELRRKF
jgi:hypothetical protein